MATTEAALSGVITEVGNSIKAIAPNRARDADAGRFTLHDMQLTAKPIEEMPGPNRLFEVKMPVEVRPFYQGYTTEGRLYEAAVTFCYRRTITWHAVATDDMAKIRHWFGNNQGGSGVSGISSRYFDYETPVTWEQNFEDPWDYCTLKLLVWADITFT